MKRNFVVSLFGSFIGFGMLLILLSATGIVGARGADVSRSDVSHINSAAASTLTSTFTYKGQLISSGSPVSNTCDFQFSLYDALSVGNRIGITQTLSSVSVSHGLFAALLNIGDEFGDTAFNGDARWLSIGLRCPAGSGVYTTLSPRQPLTSLPFALPGLRTFPNASSPNIVGGFSGNTITGGVVGSIIGGGGASGDVNTITNSWAFIGGGANNIARGFLSTIGGGANNQVNGDRATVGGGYSNTIPTTGTYAFIGGGNGNTASGYAAVVPGGFSNSATLSYTLAAGRRAKANHQGTFVWADSTAADFASTANDQFLIRATGGVGIGTANPAQALHVSGPNSRLRLESTQSDVWTVTEYKTDNREWHTGVGGSIAANGVNGKYYIYDSTAGANRMVIDTNGRVGIGTTGPDARLEVRGPDLSASTIAFTVENSDGFAGLQVYDDRTVAIGVLYSSSSTTHICYLFGFLAPCASAAEYVPTIDNGSGFAQTADLVSIAPSVKNPYDDEHAPFVVTKSNKPCDDNLLGFIINPESGADGKKLNDHYLPLAIYGYFPAKVTMENGAIHRGDALTSSSKPGYGMKATGACKIIGYALEDADHEGVVQVFANHGESTAPQVASLQAQVKDLQDQNASLDARLTALEQTMSGQTQAPGTPSRDVVLFGALLVVGIVVGRRVNTGGRS